MDLKRVFFLLFNKQPQKITPIDTWGRCRTACRSGRQCLLIGSLRRRQEEETGRCDTQQKIELRIVFTRICWTDRATSGEADTKNQEMFGDGLKDGTQQRMAGRARLHGNQWVAHPRPNEAIHHVHGHRFAASFPTGKRKRHAFIPRRWPTQNKRKRTRTVKRIEFRFSEQCPSSFHVSTGGVFFPIFFFALTCFRFIQYDRLWLGALNMVPFSTAWNLNGISEIERGFTLYQVHRFWLQIFAPFSLRSRADSVTGLNSHRIGSYASI